MEEKDIKSGPWAIIRCYGAFTLALAAELSNHGLLCWSPSLRMKRRRPRSRSVIWSECSITPSFIFLHNSFVPEAIALSEKVVSRFSLFRERGKLALIRDEEFLNFFNFCSAMNAEVMENIDDNEFVYSPGDIVCVSDGFFNGMAFSIIRREGAFYLVESEAAQIRIKIRPFHLYRKGVRPRVPD